MKTSCLLSVALLAIVSGCGQSGNSSTSQTNSTGGSVVTAPLDYLDAAGKAERSAIKTVDTTSISSAIQLFQVEKGRYPKDLNELVQEKFLPQIPPAPYGSKIVYDASTGQVKVVKE